MKTKNANGFNKHYWLDNYSDSASMDGIGNANIHARYLKSLFALEQININSIIDLGFGTGHLFRQVLKFFSPRLACGVEPSRYIFEKVDKKWLMPATNIQLTLYNEDILTWCRRKDKPYDLGICTSVLQYLSNEDIKEVLPLLAHKVRCLYFSVPTNKELARQVEELDFDDRYAFKRSRTWYQKIIRQHFTFVSARLLESKVFFNESTTPLTDLIFRF